MDIPHEQAISLFRKEMIVSEALYVNREVRAVMEQHGLKCADCFVQDEDSLETAAELHGIDLEQFLTDLNQLESDPYVDPPLQKGESPFDSLFGWLPDVLCFWREPVAEMRSKGSQPGDA